MKALLGVTALERFLEQPASSEEETRVRERLPMYASRLHSDWILTLSQKTQRY